MRAADTFDPSAGKTWAAWAIWCISNELRATLKATKRRSCCDSLDVPAFEDGEESRLDLVADESASDISTVIETDELLQAVHAAIERLTDPDVRKAVILRGLHKKPYAEAAQAAGMP